MTDTFTRTAIGDILRNQEKSRRRYVKAIQIHERTLARVRDDLAIVDHVIAELNAKLLLAPPEINDDPIYGNASIQQTLSIFQEAESIRGLAIKDIADAYLDGGDIPAMGTLHTHIDKLILDGAIYQVNPNAQRYRRFKATILKQ